MSFEVYTVLVVLIIFGIFYYYAGKAEKVVDAKARAARAAENSIGKSKEVSNKKAISQNQKKKKRVTV